MQFFGDLPNEKEMAEAMQEFKETITDEEIAACCGAPVDELGFCTDCHEHSGTFYGMPWFTNDRGENPLQEFNKIMEKTFLKA